MSELLPFTDGLTHFYDYKDYVSAATEWVNKSSGGNLIVTGGSFDNTNKCVKLPQSTGYAYCPYNIGNNCTVYAIVKGDKPTIVTWGIAVINDGSYRVYCGQESSNNTWVFYTPTSVNTNISATEWHVIAFSVANGMQKIYFDGELILTTSTVGNFALKGLYINNGAYNGGALSGTSTYSATMYLRCVALCTTNHTDDQIRANSEQLAVDFELKEAEKDSRLAGADAAAITYAIAKNNETMSALEDIIKSYREGVKEGDDGDGEVTEVIDEDGNVPVEPPMDEDDPDDVDLRGADVYYTVEGADGTLYYLRIYTLKETGIGSSERGSYEYAWTYLLVYDLYDENGSAIKTEMPINTYYSAYVVPSNVWYFKPSHVAADYVNTGYNIYMYVEKVRFTGESIVVHWVTVHAVKDEVSRGTSVTTVKGIPDGATIIHTSTSRPFTD